MHSTSRKSGESGALADRDSHQDQDSLLVKRRNDNHSPGPVIRDLVPSSHQRSGLSNAAGHIMTGNLRIISDSRIRYIVSKGPKYRFPSRIDFKKCREEIASALNDFGNRWCKREYVEPDALKEWKVSIFKIVDQHIKFYSQNINLLPPKPKSTFRHLKQGIQKVCFGSSRQGRKQRCCCLTVTLY